MKYRFILLFLCLISVGNVASIHGGQQDSPTQPPPSPELQDGEETQKGYIDLLHENTSAQVKRWSTIVDDTLVDMGDYLAPREGSDEEDEQPLTEEEITKDNKQSVDSFFLRNKYLDEISGSYVSIRTRALFGSKDDTDFNLKIKAQLDLSRSTKRFKLFINDLTEDNAKNISSSDKDEEEKPEIGINYFAPEKYGLTSKYSLGLRGVYPYVRARYKTEFHAGVWLIEPIQTLRYSVDDKFKEETQVYFDTQISNLSLLRIYLGRGTEYDVPGMSYDGSLTLFWAPMENLGFSLSQYCNGSTKFEYTDDKRADPVVTEQMNGIYNYGTRLSIRQSFYRKWLFYEIQPGVNFHKEYDYDANYTLRIFFDIYFGNI